MEALSVRKTIYYWNGSEKFAEAYESGGSDTRSTLLINKIIGLRYIISYKPGQISKVSDALSRKDTIATFQFLLLSNPTFDFLAVLLKENKTLSDLQEIHRELR